MNDAEVRTHWEAEYVGYRPEEVSWYQREPERSLRLIAQAGVPFDGWIIDAGAGESVLADRLLARGFQHLSLLDISPTALATTRVRLGALAERVDWIEADATRFEPPRAYDLWHDRAVFHFLTEAADRAAYRGAMIQTLKPGGHAVISTFAPDGPERCSGLPVRRYDARSLLAELGPRFTLLAEERESHHPPSGKEQRFMYALLRRLPA